MSSFDFNAGMFGIRDMLKNLDRLENEVKQAVRQASIENALHLLAEAVQQAPLYIGGSGGTKKKAKVKGKGKRRSVKRPKHVGGKLRASGTVVIQNIKIAEGNKNGGIKVTTRLNRQQGLLSRKIEVLVGFNTVYAMKQHEELGYRHEEGKAKYLEDPLKANKERYHKNVVDEIQRVLSQHFRT